MKRYPILLLMLISHSVYTKVLIMTYVHSRPDFIELHVKTFKNFLKDDYEYVVFNDAPNRNMQLKIEQTCQNLAVRCFRVPNHKQNRQHPGTRHMDGIKYSFDLLGFNHDDILVMVDADMFLVRPFSIVDCLKGYDMVGVKQIRTAEDKTIMYVAPSLVFMDMKMLPNKRTISFEGGYIQGLACDVGAQMYTYFRNNTDIRLKLIDPVTISTLPDNSNELAALGYDENTIDLILINRCFEYYVNGTFIHHYAGGSNWPGYSAEVLAKKKNALFQLVDKQISFYK